MCYREIHHDERLLVIDKPSGLLSVPGVGPEKQDCLASRVQVRHPGARIVHRLDRDTSGVMVMALDEEAHRKLSRQFHDREVEKVYVAVVAGQVVGDAGEIDLPIRKERQGSPSRSWTTRMAARRSRGGPCSSVKRAGRVCSFDRARDARTSCGCT